MTKKKPAKKMAPPAAPEGSKLPPIDSMDSLLTDLHKKTPEELQVLLTQLSAIKESLVAKEIANRIEPKSCPGCCKGECEEKKDSEEVDLSDEEEAAAKRQPKKLHIIRLTPFELVHLRDLFNIKLPPGLGKTVSAALAEKEQRPLIEALLWHKIAECCDENDIPIGEEAPDFMVGVASMPEIGVFEVAMEPDEEESEEEAEVDEGLDPFDHAKIDEKAKKEDE